MTSQEMLSTITSEPIEKAPGVYMILCMPTGKAYIGHSKNVYRRFRQHRSELNKQSHDNQYLQAAWNKYGQSMFNFLCIKNCKIEDLAELEEYYLNQLDIELRFNLGQVLSIPISEQTKNKMSNSRKGKKPSKETIEKIRKRNIGRKHTEEDKLKMRLAHLGKSLSEETKKKLSEVHKGRPKSPEHVRKVADANRGRKKTEEEKKKISEATKAAMQRLKEQGVKLGKLSRS